MTGDRHNSNMELISQGIGNVASVFFGGFAATGAIARTATNVRAGAHSSISAIVHSLFLVVVVMWLLPLTEYIPLAALAAVLVMVAYDMSDLRTVRHIFQGPKSDWSVMILTFALTVIFDLTVAVYTGVMLASLLFMRRMSELTGIHTCVSGEEEEAAAHDIPLPDEETVPDGVETISDYLFYKNTTITSVTLPASLKKIGTAAFQGCTKLTSIALPDGFTTLGEHAFDGCSGLKTVTFGQSLTAVPAYAFSNCSALTAVDLPATVETVGDYAFRGCANCGL